MVVSQNAYFPSYDGLYWETSTPAEHQYCPTKIHDLFDYLEEKNTKSFILLIDGKIVIEKYFDNFSKKSSHEWGDAGAPLIAYLMGVAENKNLLSLEDEVLPYINQKKIKFQAEDYLKTLKIKHLLSMTSGIKKVNDREKETYLMEAEAGKEWIYHKENLELAIHVLEQASGQSINRFLFDHLRAEIGLSGSFVKRGSSTVYTGSSRAMARFGLLLFHQGKWKNKNSALGESYLQKMLSPSQTLNPSYGFFSWLSNEEGYKSPINSNLNQGYFNPNAPQDLIAGFGANGQMINIAPSKKIVWACFTEDLKNQPYNFSLNNEIWDKINQLSCNKSERAIKKMSGDAKDYLRLTSKVPIKRIMVSDENGTIHYAAEINSNELNISLKQFNKGYYFAKILFVNDVVSTQRFSVQ